MGCVFYVLLLVNMSFLFALKHEPDILLANNIIIIIYTVGFLSESLAWLLLFLVNPILKIYIKLIPIPLIVF